MKRTLLMAALLAGAAAGTARAVAPAAGIDTLFDNFFREWIAMNPDDASQFGLTPAMGYPYQKSDLTDGSERLVDRTYRYYRRYRDQLRRADARRLTPSQRQDAEILAWFLDHALRGERFRDHAPVINQMYGVHNALTNLLTEYHTITNRQDALDWLARLKQAPLRVDQTRERLALQERRGIRPPAFICDRVDTVMSQFAAAPADSCVLLASFRARVGPLAGVKQDEKAAMYRTARDIIERELYPAYGRFIAAVRASRSRA
ncbi:DUF885 family protein, partial [bacterium]|nr:DUF885 family protein [bacterium]